MSRLRAVSRYALQIVTICIVISSVVGKSSLILASPKDVLLRRQRRLENRPNLFLKKPSSVAFEKSVLSTRGGSGSSNDKIEGGKASMSASVFNLVNNVAGAGILTLSAGMAKGTGWVAAILICIMLGMVSSHTFKLIGECCELTGESNFKGLWSKSMGKETTWVVDSIISVLCTACAVIYSGILGDVFTPLLSSAGLPDKWNGRSSNIAIITTAFLFPLCIIKDLSALAFTSILGFLSIMYTVLFVVVRASDGSYKLPSDALVAGGKFIEENVITLPTFEKASLWNFDFTSLILASNLGLAYISHYNAPSFYGELRDTSAKRFGQMATIGYTILSLLYIVIMIAGYSIFGDVCQGNLLLNFHPNDMLSTIGRLATGFSILFGYPLLAFGARQGIIGATSSLGFPAVGNDRNHILLVGTLLGFVTTIAVTVDDVSTVVGLTGAVMGSFIVYILPALMYTRTIASVKGVDSVEHKKSKVNLGLIPFGICIAALGVKELLF